MNVEKVTGKRILLVDDQNEVRDTIAMVLELDAHTVIPASSGAEALRLFDADHFDLVITDYAMPGMRGDEMAMAIRQKAPSQPILMITGSANLADPVRLYVDGILYKPFMLEDLRRAMAEHLCAQAA